MLASTNVLKLKHPSAFKLFTTVYVNMKQMIRFEHVYGDYIYYHSRNYGQAKLKCIDWISLENFLKNID